MPTVGLVASQNGLGHARRLTHFAAAFRELGYEAHLFLSTRQVQALSKEIGEISPKTKVFEIEGYGLDGPAQRSLGVREIPESLQLQLKEFDFVLSDNLTWPGSFLNTFILMGHFTWVDYWKFGQPNEELEISRAITHASKISKWYSPVDFSQMPTYLNGIERIEIPLSKYVSDPKTIQSSDMNSVSFSNGTTGLNQSDENELRLQLENMGLALVTKESHSYQDSRIPALTLGRPGLGTIRDCLAFGIPFLPCWEGNDPELKSNEAALKRIGLMPAAWEGNQKPNIKIIREFLNDKEIQDRIRNYWTKNSAPITEILTKMRF
jgi:hypothetical protein